MQSILHRLYRRLGLGKKAPAGSDVDTILGDAWETDELRGKTLFIHFDEASTVSDEVMTSLRCQLRGVLASWCFAYKDNPHQPRVHFYLSGRGGALGVTGFDNIGTKRIVLHQLDPEDVGTIREVLTRDGGLDLHVRAASAPTIPVLCGRQQT